MNLLTDGLPTALLVDGIVYPISWGYRSGIAFEKAVQSGASDVQRLLEPFYGDTAPHNPAAALRMAVWFYACGRQGSAAQRNKAALTPYSFEKDEDVLYTSFYEAYKIDLLAEDLHWWTFRRLMFGLPAESLFMKIVGYRTADISKMPKQQQKFYREMRERYAITGGKKMTLTERDAQYKSRVQMYKMLAGGGTHGKT